SRRVVGVVIARVVECGVVHARRRFTGSFVGEILLFRFRRFGAPVGVVDFITCCVKAKVRKEIDNLPTSLYIKSPTIDNKRYGMNNSILIKRCGMGVK
ncbi:22584_t:CDS:2, partial [Gigaspora rosea]